MIRSMGAAATTRFLGDLGTISLTAAQVMTP
jgi:hypothetical protein